MMIDLLAHYVRLMSRSHPFCSLVVVFALDVGRARIAVCRAALARSLARSTHDHTTTRPDVGESTPRNPHTNNDGNTSSRPEHDRAPYPPHHITDAASQQRTRSSDECARRRTECQSRPLSSG
jgi:hypothetical protein